MLATTMRRVAKLAAKAVPSFRSRSAIGEARQGDHVVIMELLTELPAGSQGLMLREIHKLLDLPQPRILRAVREMEASNAIVVEQVLHDPLASLVRLSG